MAKIAFLGAGSLGFGPRLVQDMLSFPELAAGELWLVDPDAERIALIEQVARHWVEVHQLPTRLHAGTAREAALDGADYVVLSIRVGVEEEGLDKTIPFEVGGLRQTVADTVGVGGVMKGLRTIPPILDIAADMMRLCPTAPLLNYTNPMCMIQWALSLAQPPLATVGLCHSVQHTSSQLAGYLGLPLPELRWRVAGINHLAWFTQLEHQGEDLYPRLRACLDDPETYAKDKVRFDIFRQFGLFVTESSRHMAEYVPYYLGHDAERERLDLPNTGAIEPGKRTQWMQERAAKVAEMATGDAPLKRSNEYGARIIHAMLTDQPIVIAGNMPNHGLIPNLLPGCCVEVPTLVHRAGLRPCYAGPLPPQCAALCATNVAMQELVVKAVLEQDREAAIRAAMIDPCTAAQLPLATIREVMEALFAAQASILPAWLR
ncbi:MAG: hypothetical protein IT204_23430 [Fimbriimonadaceae bacterium]|nr:hypothetical protein [Fimbriimonadaceae bacterium]